MGLRAVLAVLVLLFFGKNLRTDAFFAAYGVFAVPVVGGEVRPTAVVPPVVGAADGDAARDGYLGAVLGRVGVAAVPVGVLGPHLASLLVASLGPVAEETARGAL